MLFRDDEKRDVKWMEIVLQDDGKGLERHIGRAHPGAENGGMGGGVVMGMMRRMRNGLGINEPAEEQEASCEAPDQSLADESAHIVLSAARQTEWWFGAARRLPGFSVR